MTTTEITVTREGRRSYLRGNTYPLRDTLRAAKAHWDPEQRAWWLGDDAAAREIAAQAVAAASPVGGGRNKGQGEDTTVAGRATYHGRACYIVGRVVRGRTDWDTTVAKVCSRDGTRVLLCSRDGARQWWAAVTDVIAARPYGRPRTIGDLRSFRERLANGEIETCGYCGSPSCEGARGGLCEED